MDCLYTQRQKYRFLSGLFGTMVVKKQLKPNLDIHELLSEKQLEKPNYRCAILFVRKHMQCEPFGKFSRKRFKSLAHAYSARVIYLLAILLAITWLSDYPHALQRRVICSLAILLAMPNSNRK